MKINRQSYKLPDDLAAVVRAKLDDWQRSDKSRRLWRGDASLWTANHEGGWLGWLRIVEEQLANLQHLVAMQQATRKAAYEHALLLGMGGSTLAAEVMSRAFGNIAGYPGLRVLDSTDPAQVRAVEGQIDYRRTLFIVSSKSGRTLEPDIFKQYFFERARRELGSAAAAGHFIAITDPGSRLQQMAESDHFAQIFFGLRNIGGRYSALSDFGMVPAAIMGVDVSRFLKAAQAMVRVCGESVPAEQNPGVLLGVILGTLGVQGRDKITLAASPGIFHLGAWLEQLIAESTGKNGKGLIPVDREGLTEPGVYGNDRVFVYLRLESAPDQAQDAAIAALEAAGQPVVRIDVEDEHTLGQEFFRWEMATAVAGAVIGVNPFDQPDVEAAKIAARRLTSEYEQRGSLPSQKPLFEQDGMQLYTDEKSAAALRSAVSQKSLTGFLKAHFDRIRAGDYFALLAFVEMSGANEGALQAIRHAVRDAKRVATCLGFGPRFLHSTGQAYKGGPDTGVFLQITSDDAHDLPVPGRKFTFGIVKAAQARGDFQVLAERGRRVLRVHLGADVIGGLAALRQAVEASLK